MQTRVGQTCAALAEWKCCKEEQKELEDDSKGVEDMRFMSKKTQAHDMKVEKKLECTRKH